MRNSPIWGSRNDAALRERIDRAQDVAGTLGSPEAVTDDDRIIALVRAECDKVFGHEDKDWMIRFLALTVLDQMRGVSPGFMRLPPVAPPKLPRKPPHKDIR